MHKPFKRLPLVVLAMLLPAGNSAYGQSEYSNPVYAGRMPDPGVMLHNGRYYAFGTTGNQRLGDGRVFRVLTSDDLVHWQEEGGALEPFSPDPSLEYWAPEAVEHNGKFYLYYSAGTLPDLRFEIRVAVSNHPTGPYRDNGHPLRDGQGAKFFIDGHPYQDEDGQWYFFYAKDFLDTDNGCRAGTGIVVDRLIDMSRLEGNPRVVVRPRHDWTLYESNRRMPMYGNRVFDWHTIEGPWVTKHQGKYYCFYSGSNFATENYGVDYVAAPSVMGPYDGQGDRARVLSKGLTRVRGPGHHSVVPTRDRSQLVVVYHAWDKTKSHRQMCVDPLFWTSLGPRCDGPSVRPRRLNSPPPAQPAEATR